MEPLHYDPDGSERPKLLDANEVVRDLSAHFRDIDGALLEDLSVAEAKHPESLPAVEGLQEKGSCITDVGKFVCIGVYYSDHAAETNWQILNEPVGFLKAISGSNDDVAELQGGRKPDWEPGIVSWQSARKVSGEDALQHVSGSAFRHEPQWTKEKSCDTLGPTGPCVATRNEIADPLHDLSMWHDINGDRKQQGSTRTMMFRVPFIDTCPSQLFTLRPGHVISHWHTTGRWYGHDTATVVRRW